MVTAPFLPNRPAQPARSVQDVVACIGTAAVRLPGFSVPAGRNDGMRGAKSDGLVTVPRVVGAIATDAGDALVGWNLLQQRWQDGRITDAVVGHLHGSDLERGRVDPKVHLAPLAAILRPVLLRLPLTFAQHLDARAVHQQMQSGRGRYCPDGNLKRLLPPADRAVVRRRPIKSRQAQQALRHAHGLAQRQIEQAFDTQAELDRFVAEHLAAPALATRLAVPVHLRIEPDEQRAACLEGFVVCLPVGRAVLLWSWFHPFRLPDLQAPRWPALIYATKPIAVIDIVFSLDSVITAVSMVDQISVMIAAVIFRFS